MEKWRIRANGHGAFYVQRGEWVMRFYFWVEHFSSIPEAIAGIEKHEREASNG